MFSRLVTASALCSLLLLCGAARTDSPEQVIRGSLLSAKPDLNIERIAVSELPGLYRIELHGGQMLYATPDGKHFIAGDLYTVQNKQLVNLGDLRRNAQRREMMSKVKVSDTVVFAPPKGATKAIVNVFTDVDCGYCQKLHSQIAEYNALGIEIHYLAYPRSGLKGETHMKLVTAWCSTNRQDAITQLKLRKELPPRNCANPVDAEYALGEAVGVTGTPSLVLANGQLVPGYVPPQELARMLGISSS